MSRTDWTAISEQLIERCNGRCEFCGISLSYEWERHHRLLRSAGGRDESVNLLALHALCHNQQRNSIHDNPVRSYALGHLVSRHDRRRPSEVPVRLWNGRWVYLRETSYVDAHGLEISCVDCDWLEFDTDRNMALFAYEVHRARVHEASAAIGHLGEGVSMVAGGSVGVSGSGLETSTHSTGGPS